MFVEGLQYHTEQLPFRLLGLRKEFPELQWGAAAQLSAASAFHILKHRTAIEGYPLPEKGAVIVTGNHRDDGDSREIWWAAMTTAHRVLRPVVKMSLIVEGATEPEEYLKSIDALEEEGFGVYNNRVASVLKGIGAIGVMRNNPDREFLRQCHKVLGNDEMLGIFLQPSRNQYLKHLQQGAANLARMYPNAVVCPIAFGKNRVKLLEQFTYAELSEREDRKISPAELTIMIADMVARELPEDVQKDWVTSREIELARLSTPSNKQTA